MFVLIPLCLALMSVFIYQERLEHWTSAMVLKGCASACFVILGFLASKGGHTANLITAGLLIGAIADVLLALRFVVKEKGKLVFLIGILVFLTGHLVYLSAILPMNSHKLICFIAGILLTAVIMKWIFTKITAEKAFKIFGIVYIGAIVILNCIAFGNLFDASSAFAKIFALGAFLFLISDIVLILNSFGPEQKFSLRITNLDFYYCGQILIALSLLYL